MPAVSPDGGPGSLSLYGLVARFIGSFEVGTDDVRWRYRLTTASPVKPDAHPAGQRFSDGLIEVQAAILRAAGQLLAPGAGEAIVPGLEVRLDRERVALLEHLHANTDWVVTADRFFGVDYYDSPNDAALGQVARKYLIDHSPEFTEGLGHRMIVTTAWRDEVAAILRRAMEELGFAAVDSSVRQLLHYLKTVSGRLALQALSPESSGAAAVSLGAVMAWLQAKGRLAQAVLIPVDAHVGVFGPHSQGAIPAGQRRCDLVLMSLRRGIVDATFIEVKWRRGQLGNLDDLIEDMSVQMHMTGEAVERRFFSPDRCDGALQRAHLANLLRFYCARARRYGLLDPDTATTFLNHLAQFEKTGADFRPAYEGFVVNLEHQGQRPVVRDGLTVTVLTARDFEHSASNLLVTLPVESVAGQSARTVTDASVSSDALADGIDEEPNSDGPDSRGPAEREVSSDTTEVEVVLGDGPAGEVIWRPAVQGSPHLFITGIPGQGKSWTTLRLLLELSRQRVPALVLDFHGQLGADDSPYRHTAQPLVIDAASGLPFSPFECNRDAGAAGWNATALAIAEIFAYVCGLGDIQRDTLFTCIRDSYRAYGFGSDTEDDHEEFPTLQDVLARIERADRHRQAHNLLARCRPLLEMDLFRPPAGRRTSLLDALRQGTAIDLHRLPSETLQLAAGAFLLRKVYRDMFAWGPASRLRLAIVLDEAHRLARDITLPKIMKEGRKFGVAVVVASQGLADFHPDVLGTAGTKIAFRANYPESRRIAGFFRPRPGQDLAALVEGLEVGRALVQTPEMPTTTRACMRPPT